MTTSSRAEALASELDIALRTVPGVSALFRAGPRLSSALDAGARLIGVRDAADPLVRVDLRRDGFRADVALSVQDRVGAVETIRRVRAAAAAVADRRGVPLAGVRVTVVHVDESGRGRPHDG